MRTEISQLQNLCRLPPDSIGRLAGRSDKPHRCARLGKASPKLNNALALSGQSPHFVSKLGMMAVDGAQ